MAGRLARLAGALAAAAAPWIGGGAGPPPGPPGAAPPSGPPGRSSGALVVDLDAVGGGRIFSWASKTRRILASNTKLFTTAALLERYGPSARLRTRVWAVGQRAGARDRGLDGRL